MRCEAVLGVVGASLSEFGYRSQLGWLGGLLKGGAKQRSIR